MSSPKSSKNNINASNSALDRSVNASPQIVFKMAKKIAQLTKVIYFLHSKTEDHDDELDYLSEKIQEHVQSINEKAKIHIADLTTKADEARILLKAHEEMISVTILKCLN